MKKVLVTVGTTPFNSLFEALENCDIPEGLELECQIAEGTYVPRKFSYFRFSDDFAQKLMAADAVISHAGAGTVFSLLELAKPAIVVANLERKDNHQIELARYVAQSELALGVLQIDALQTAINQLPSFTPASYHKELFFFQEQLNSNILNACFPSLQ
ncbi:PssE/Cps14G family polysaccharide biosynthesis glycosyltransferase [Planctobacterium marinum]|uniref:Glycosyl transferase family 28 C-terminal domain-containing protein n=1 Tax=Planctobacterium marinum TaxID=1631968 RepID=A0AA48KSY7_9ALTE|nr:hypothetical protein MACH26_31730 [Planctobacterium marinum]